MESQISFNFRNLLHLKTRSFFNIPFCVQLPSFIHLPCWFGQEDPVSGKRRPARALGLCFLQFLLTSGSQLPSCLSRGEKYGPYTLQGVLSFSWNQLKKFSEQSQCCTEWGIPPALASHLPLPSMSSSRAEWDGRRPYHDSHLRTNCCLFLR